MTAQTANETVPVYLCQVSPNVSCGACCGLYNVAEPTPDALEALLMQRTRRFARFPRTIDGIDAFKETITQVESRTQPFPRFHHCPFLGLIEDTGQRVGCLLHPMANGNGGIDWRGLSYYGGFACRTYFCPSTRQLPSRWLNAIGQAMDHWYLHGLIVTERRLLNAFFNELEKRLDRPVRETDFSANSDAAALLREFASLKIDWRFRREDAPGGCNYFFEDGQYNRPTLPQKKDSTARSAFQAIFEELDSSFASASAYRDAGKIIDSILRRLVDRLR